MTTKRITNKDINYILHIINSQLPFIDSSLEKIDFLEYNKKYQIIYFVKGEKLDSCWYKLLTKKELFLALKNVYRMIQRLAISEFKDITNKKANNIMLCGLIEDLNFYGLRG